MTDTGEVFEDPGAQLVLAIMSKMSRDANYTTNQLLDAYRLDYEKYKLLKERILAFADHQDSRRIYEALFHMVYDVESMTFEDFPDFEFMSDLSSSNSSREGDQEGIYREGSQ